MAYSRVWTDTTPVSTDPASGAPNDMQHIRIDLRERLMTMFAMPDFTSDPLKVSAVSLGYNTAGFGGFVKFIDDTGTYRWFSGIGSGAGNKNFVIFDTVNSASRLSIDYATGNVTIANAITLNGGFGANASCSINTGNLTVAGFIQANANIIASTGLTVTTGGIHVAAGDVQLDQTLHVAGVITATGGITGNISGSSGSCTGNAGTATSLQTGRYINSVFFDGTANITVPASANTLTGTALPALNGANLTSLTGANVTGTVANATNATNATTAGNATNLGGVGSGSYALKSGTSALVVTGASVTAAAFYVV